ncbi:MAG: hypothetical protein H0W09_02115, partial [Solirubrobacterales bacterium]|nr:hypothetical protein [Solirubrobacterales bacterium]
GTPFRRPTAEMRANSAKPRGIKKQEPRVTTPDEHPVRVTKGIRKELAR